MLNRENQKEREKTRLKKKTWRWALRGSSTTFIIP
jgi:hypothetical protein